MSAQHNEIPSEYDHLPPAESHGISEVQSTLAIYASGVLVAHEASSDAETIGSQVMNSAIQDVTVKKYDYTRVQDPVRNKARNSVDMDALKLYPSQLSRHTALTSEEVADISEKVKTGIAAQASLAAAIELSADTTKKLESDIVAGLAAKERFILANLGLVVRIASRLHQEDTILDFLDLIQEGYLGLEHAIAKFDHNKGFQFSTYAAWWIKKYINREIIDKSRSIRLSPETHGLISSVSRAKHDFLSEYSVEPNLEQLSELTGLPIPKLRELILLDWQRPTSLHQKARRDDDAEIGEFIRDEKSDDEYIAVEDRVEYSKLDALIEGCLDCNEKYVLRSFYGIGTKVPMTLKEIGLKLHLSRDQVTRLKNRALQKIRLSVEQEDIETVAALD